MTWDEAARSTIRLTLREYQDFTAETDTSQHLGLMYYGLGVAGEAGEVADCIKKLFRDNRSAGSPIDVFYVDLETRRKLILELGDTLYYLASIARHIDVTLDEIAKANIEKLISRKERGKIQGSGDDR